MITASAPGKVILVGEHAVVYGRPAIAVPVTEARTTAHVRPGAGEGITIHALDTNEVLPLGEAPPDHPLVLAATLTLEALAVEEPPPLRIEIRSELPMAAGLGSGASVSVALIRALSERLGAQLSAERQSELAYEVEKIHHGTPSGIDNTVIAFGQPVRFEQGSPPAVLTVPVPFRLLIGDTGIPSPTGQAVAGVRARWQAQPEEYERLFDEIGAIAEEAQGAIASGQSQALGPLLDRNQTLLQKLEVSHPKLERLNAAAQAAGALGAKLSGGGRGGNMIALVPPEATKAVSAALTEAGAVRVLATEVGR